MFVVMHTTPHISPFNPYVEIKYSHNIAKTMITLTNTPQITIDDLKEEYAIVLASDGCKRLELHFCPKPIYQTLTQLVVMWGDDVKYIGEHTQKAIDVYNNIDMDMMIEAVTKVKLY